MSDAKIDYIVPNGIHIKSGDYILPKQPVDEISKIAQGKKLSLRYLDLLRVYSNRNMPHLGVEEERSNLESEGWGVIFAQDADPAIRDALSPLLKLRKDQAKKRYREFSGKDGYNSKTAESRIDFLAHFGLSPGILNSDKMPNYLLIVGDPETIPFRFQYELDTLYFVGRIYFSKLEAYSNYARSVVAAETWPTNGRRITFFGPLHDEDESTELSSLQLVKPLADSKVGVVAGLKAAAGPWESRLIPPELATRPNLISLLAGSAKPAVLFCASHGAVCDCGDGQQYERQGALLCQEWPGPKWKGAIPERFYVSEKDVDGNSSPFGLIAFFFACFSGGTPRVDDFAIASQKKTPEPLAPKAFLAALPQKLLGHANGGALAVVAHVDRVWSSSFFWTKVGRQIEPFKATLTSLLSGKRIGEAMENFNLRSADLSVSLTNEQRAIRNGATPNNEKLADLWITQTDAQNYIVIGDPAVRAAVALPEV